MNLNLETILGRLRKISRAGAGWIACCPAHPDRSPSLSIQEQSGRILVHCFAGCSVEAICIAIGITTKQLFTQPRAKPEPAIVRQTKKQIESLRGRLTPRDREREVTVVLANHNHPDAAFARALALAVEGELVQVLFKEEE